MDPRRTTSLIFGALSTLSLLAVLSGCVTSRTAPMPEPEPTLPPCPASLYSLQGYALPDYIQLVRFDGSGSALALPPDRPCKSGPVGPPLAGYPLPDFVTVTRLGPGIIGGATHAVE